MLAPLVIGLREGPEAALSVGVIAAFPRRNGTSLKPIGLGVGAAAVVIVTFIILWMSKNSRSMKSTLEACAGSALKGGSVMALSGMAFLAVLREGVETAVFMVAAFQSSMTQLAAGFGAVLGLVMKSLRTAHEAGWPNVGEGSTINLPWLVPNCTARAAILSGGFPCHTSDAGHHLLRRPFSLAAGCAGNAHPSRCQRGQQRRTRRERRSTPSLALVETAADGSEESHALTAHGTESHAGRTASVFTAEPPSGAIDEPATLLTKDLAGINGGRMPVASVHPPTPAVLPHPGSTRAPSRCGSRTASSLMPSTLSAPH
ncbi:FTR1 family protein [Arthrobacter sp. LAPM80]|uniref:FTR1 family iron permease n=1 Tax=Arthrobacter sp. LAPM80 TaxID=3141788 RepID=UPI00398AE107